ALNIADVFRKQEGKLFGRVESVVLLDEKATKQQIDQGIAWLRGVGKAGDFIVLFQSGHGNRRQGTWHFVPHDYDSANHLPTAVSDVHMIKAADAMAAQGKKVLIIVDACFAGQIRHSARDLLNRKHPNGGGVILMVSSMPSQTSAALGRFSAFAQA